MHFNAFLLFHIFFPAFIFFLLQKHRRFVLPFFPTFVILDASVFFHYLFDPFFFFSPETGSQDTTQPTSPFSIFLFLSLRVCIPLHTFLVCDTVLLRLSPFARRTEGRRYMRFSSSCLPCSSLLTAVKIVARLV